MERVRDVTMARDVPPPRMACGVGQCGMGFGEMDVPKIDLG